MPPLSPKCGRILAIEEREMGEKLILKDKGKFKLLKLGSVGRLVTLDHDDLIGSVGATSSGLKIEIIKSTLN